VKVIYEVNLDIDAGIYQTFRDWLQTHIQEMLTIPGFETAKVYQPLDNDDSSCEQLCIHYLLTNKKHLENYFKNDAQRMRQDALQRFGDKFKANRRILGEMMLLAMT